MAPTKPTPSCPTPSDCPPPLEPTRRIPDSTCPKDEDYCLYKGAHTTLCTPAVKDGNQKKCVGFEDHMTPWDSLSCVGSCPTCAFDYPMCVESCTSKSDECGSLNIKWPAVAPLEGLMWLKKGWTTFNKVESSDQSCGNDQTSGICVPGDGFADLLPMCSSNKCTCQGPGGPEVWNTTCKPGYEPHCTGITWPLPDSCHCDYKRGE